jgi:hypothetical protein
MIIFLAPSEIESGAVEAKTVDVRGEWNSGIFMRGNKTLLRCHANWTCAYVCACAWNFWSDIHILS